jgi:hypothetical protein
LVLRAAGFFAGASSFLGGLISSKRSPMENNLLLLLYCTVVG